MNSKDGRYPMSSSEEIDIPQIEDEALAQLE